MAAPVFLSYSWEDMAEVDDLDEMVRLRGVPVWRDRRAMRWGGYNEDLVRHAILDEISGFVLYLTPAAIADEAWFIPEVELRAMDDRRTRNGAFFNGAVFRGYGVRAGTEAVYERAHVDVGATLGSEVGERELLGAMRESANAIAREYLAAQWRSGPVAIRIETRNQLPVADEALVHLALSPPLTHDPDDYDVAVWDEKILPALADLQDALHTIQLAGNERERVLEIAGAAHLSAALAFGYAFREPTRWSLRLRHHEDVWETKREPGNLDGWDVPQPRAGSGREDLVVMVHATADVREAARTSAGGLARAELHVTPPGGPDKLSLNPETANAAAAGIAKAIREARATYAPKETRLYLAAPWPFATLLGWHLGSCGPIVMHEANAPRDSYRVSAVLRQ
jgi:hypothetical protein